MKTHALTSLTPHRVPAKARFFLRVALGFVTLGVLGASAGNVGRADEPAKPVTPSEPVLVPGTYSSSAADLAGTFEVNVHNQVCMGKEATLAAVRFAAREEILSWCNNKYPGNCGEQQLCFSRVIHKGAAAILRIELKAGSSGESFGALESSRDTSIAISFKFEGTTSNSVSVTCSSPLETPVGRAFSEALDSMVEERLNLSPGPGFCATFL